MFKRMLVQFVELLLFLAALYGFMLVLLVVGDGMQFVQSAKYYIWIILPLLSFGLIFGTISILYKNIFKKNSTV